MDIGTEFAVELSRVSRRWRTRLDERLKHTGLTQARWVVLLQLSKFGAAPQRELADRISVEGPTLVRTLDKLEELGLVTRRACEDDRRVKFIHLTPQAEPVIAEITRIADELRLEILADIPIGELDQAWRTLKTVGDRLENL
ncbi:MarR family transcriptional regulator [Aquamicrobium sp. LC103]|uniref:MarR family transcriptional regulator n=1 Tax=Aquamicrobium sp. LC103 TaxID=1120658 RepID=UPI0010C96F00|nr:MarR family transcriptional regulator [Aquamicrobium sp. LC103]TKT74399.1 MarR family transcriptional regulator [Aquamicrobium sp. LC103]